MPSVANRRSFADVLRVGVAFLTVAVLQYFLSSAATAAVVGSRELASALHLAEIVVMFGAAAVVVVSRGVIDGRSFQRVALGVTWVFTIVFLLKLLDLILGLDRTRQPDGGRLLVDAAMLWVNNVLIFAIWYWMLDSGGPEGRQHPDETQPVDFLFPQEVTEVAGYRDWTPNYFDYAYIAFCVNTTLGPSDTIALSRRTKLLLMVQALASIVILSVVAARAIGAIGI